MIILAEIFRVVPGRNWAETLLVIESGVAGKERGRDGMKSEEEWQSRVASGSRVGREQWYQERRMNDERVRLQYKNPAWSWS